MCTVHMHTASGGGLPGRYLVKPGAYRPRETSTVVGGGAGTVGRGGDDGAGGGGAAGHHTPVVFDARQVAELLPMKACVKSMVAALTALSDGSAIMPVRQVVRLPIKSKVGVLAAGEKSNLAENLARGH